MTEKKERSVADLELATMRQCRRLLERLPLKARLRVVAYLSSLVNDLGTTGGDPAPLQNELGF